jgi:hypothetical protein
VPSAPSNKVQSSSFHESTSVYAYARGLRPFDPRSGALPYARGLRPFDPCSGASPYARGLRPMLGGFALLTHTRGLRPMLGGSALSTHDRGLRPMLGGFALLAHVRGLRPPDLRPGASLFCPRQTRKKTHICNIYIKQRYRYSHRASSWHRGAPVCSLAITFDDNLLSDTIGCASASSIVVLHVNATTGG